MHGSWRKRLVPLVLTASVPVALAASTAARGSHAGCPFGTNWDGQAGLCR